jgi:hypothetical protein
MIIGMTTAGHAPHWKPRDTLANRVVQELARHSQLSTTALYVAATDTRQRLALEMLG